MKNLRFKIKHRIRRYGPSELLGTMGAIGGGYLGLHLTGSEVAASFFGAWGENVGYYGYGIAREVEAQIKLGNKGLKMVCSAVKEMVMEFGVSELLDSFLIRPACMYTAASLISNYGLGLFVGKVVADIVFYLPTTYFYHRRLKKDINRLLDNIEDKLKML